MNPNTSVTKTEWNSLRCFLRYINVHKFSGHCLLLPWPLTFWPQNLISTSLNSGDQHRVKFPSLVFETWCSQDFQGSQTHALTYTPTDGHIWMQYACGTVLQRWRRHNNNYSFGSSWSAFNWKAILWIVGGPSSVHPVATPLPEGLRSSLIEVFLTGWKGQW